MHTNNAAIKTDGRSTDRFQRPGVGGRAEAIDRLTGEVKIPSHRDHIATGSHLAHRPVADWCV